MKPANDPATAEITFLVSGQSLPTAGTSRGAGPAASAPGFGGRGTVLQRVQVGARRGNGEVVRVSARPGLDAVVLHITNGPSLMLHPETARDLMRAQAGQGGVAQRSAGSAASPAGAQADDVVVPAQLSWQGLEQAGAARGATRGGFGDVLLSAFEVVTDLLREPAAQFTAAKIGAHVDGQVDAGLYQLSADGFGAPLKGSAPPLTTIPPSPGTKAPLLVLLHGTFSETHGTFHKLWKEHPQSVRELFAFYGNRVYGLDHPTLTVSPIDNALMLARALPQGARVHLLTHSRGGLVAEVLARACAEPTLDAASLGPFQGEPYKAQRAALAELTAVLKGRDIQVERMVRVACPARGTLLASKRLDAYVSVLKWALELAAIPVAPVVIDFLGAVASQRMDAKLLPGLEAMAPDGALVQWLNSAATPLPGQLRVVAGDLQGDSIMSWAKTLLSDAFFWTDNDLVVQTRSMYGGAPRALAGNQANASFVFDQGGQVTHFNYFSNPRTAQAVCSGLMQQVPSEFRPIGPMSWAGTSSDGLRSARRAAGDKPAAERPALILLPGILGSHLRVAGERVWLSSSILGGLKKIEYVDGVQDIHPDGVMGYYYSALADFFANTHEVTEFGFDWRRPIQAAAQDLADAMDAALNARAATSQPVHLLAHSMGGLLARTVQIVRPKTWQAWLARPGSRLLMLGTPNGGSFTPMQVLSGDDNLGNALAFFGLPFQDHEARQIMAGMPGFLQLQAGLLDPALKLGNSQQWQALAEQDLKTVRQANLWFSDALQQNAYTWGVPPQAVLDQAVAWRTQLDQQLQDSPAEDKQRMLMVVGHAKFTPAGYVFDEREGLVYLNAPDDGDGRVTRSSALLPGVRAWRVDCAHGDLPRQKEAFGAYFELLTRGDTQLLAAAANESTRAGAAPSSALQQVRSRPSRQRRPAGQPPTGTNEVVGDATEPHFTATAGPRGAALRVSVQNANFRFVSTTLMLGHYGALALSGAEYVVDKFIGGGMKASLEAGLYPEAPGTHQVFINTKNDPEQSLTLPRPPHVVVVGLGEEGKLRSTDLTRTVRQATMAWAQRLAETPGQGAAQFELSATLIGSGGTGISVGASAQAVAQGVREANQKLADAGWPQCSNLRLVELYLDRATEAWHALQMLAEASPDHFVLTPTVLPGQGALRRRLDGGYRGTDYDFISATTEYDEFGEPKIVYTLDTKRARSEVRAQSTQKRLVGELVQSASNDANRDPQIGRTLFQLLVPLEMEAHLGGSSEMLLELDEGTAAIPWELLDAPEAGRTGASEPWAIRSKLLRKLRTVEFRHQVSDARRDDAVLVIGEPKADPKKYPPLPAARAEAEAVRDLLGAAGGLEVSLIESLIAEGDGLGPDAAEVIGALLARRYRIVHIAGHGEPEEVLDEKPKQQTSDNGVRRDQRAEPTTRLRGVVLSDDTFLGPREVQAMRVVPELVFLNCCHLAADPQKLLKAGYDRASFAAGVAKQLIRVGVRCVVAAGWAVEDAAASGFATAFYGALLGGQRFMDAVHAGRVEARRISPHGNTWAAYQCYGDPDWEWRRNDQSAGKKVVPVAQEFAGIASPVALALALETLAQESATQGKKPDQQLEKIRHLQARFESQWGGMGAVAEAFGVAYAGAKATESAIEWYGRAQAAGDGSASIKASEQLANLRVRLAWDRVDKTRKGKKKGTASPVLQSALAQGRVDIQLAMAVLDSLVSLAPTVERGCLLGSAHKRLAMLEEVAEDTAAADKAIASMATHYRDAEELARKTQDPKLFYPALNRIAAELLQWANDKTWGGFAAADLDPVQQNLEHAARANPDFWCIVGITELRVYQALASKSLAKDLQNIVAAYKDVQGRAGSAWMWASVADQAGWVLGRFGAGAGAEAQAAQQLLGMLQGYAGT